MFKWFVITFAALAMFTAGAIAWRWWSRVRRKAASPGDEDARHTAEALIRLQELATWVAFDVNDHSHRVEEINEEIENEPAMITDSIRELIQMNQQLREKLTSIECNLRDQAQELRTWVIDARTDALTLLANRRAFDEELGRRFDEYSRLGHTFYLIMADVDHFKKFNDTHGHQVGDEVLRNVAKLLCWNTREMDRVTRYGGDEFAIMIPGVKLDSAGTAESRVGMGSVLHGRRTVNLEDACQAALRVCQALEKSCFRHHGKDLQVTASFGVAEVSGCMDAAAVVARADKALYAAKTGGRICVYLNDGGEGVHCALADPQTAPRAAVPRTIRVTIRTRGTISGVETTCDLPPAKG